MTPATQTHLIRGERVALPVRIRDASAASAMFAVPAAPAQAMIAYSGLELAEPFPGRAICSLVFIRYADGDLGAYHEFAVAFLVRPPRPGPHANGQSGLKDLQGIRNLGNVGAFVHWLPVDQEFTLEAGRSIWGFPKELAEIPMDLAGRVKRCAVRFGGRTAIEVAVSSGVPVPTGQVAPELSAYSCLDGITRRIPWTMRMSGLRMRPGGARVRLGDHPVAQELREIGLDRTRPLGGTSASHMAMSFAGAEEVVRQ